jgi:CrcB protein
MNWLIVFLGGGIGSMLRFGVGKLIPFKGISFPWSTFFSNFLACLIFAFALIVIQKSPKNDWIQPFVLVGICGGFSTFSTFSFENYQLFQTGNYGILLLNIFVSLILGFGTFWVVKLF